MPVLVLIIFFFCLGCVEPYEFAVKNNQPSLVVEGYISNVSYSESISYPSDGRYFTVDLRYTSDVTNQRDDVVTNAAVHLISETGEMWAYTATAPGSYQLLDKDFEAFAGVAYKLKITLTDEIVYESAWEKIEQEAPAIGIVGFEEVEKQIKDIEAGKEVIKANKGINVFIDVPENSTGKPIFYRWDFEPMWVYIAPLAPSYQPDYRCWATNKNYLSGYTLQLDNVGGYRKDLFFIPVEQNERIFDDLSILVRQQSLSEDFFYFWKEMQEQVGGGTLSDAPPFNLQTNISSLNGEVKVSGYFGVVDEKARRWYFNSQELSYWINNSLLSDCQTNTGPGGPPPSCTSCLSYEHGTTTNIKPAWWR